MSDTSEVEGGDALSLVSCPECSDVASVEWQTWLDGVLHLKLRCLHRHWFFMPADGTTGHGTQVPHHPEQASTADPPSRPATVVP